MANFNEILAKAKEQLQDLVDGNNVEKIAGIAKTFDSLETEYKAVEKEKQDAKDSLVKYVKEYAFKEKEPDTTGTDLPPTIDEAIEEAFKDLK